MIFIYCRLITFCFLAICLSGCSLRKVDHYTGMEISPCVLSIIKGRSDCSSYVDPSICSCEKFISGDPSCELPREIEEFSDILDKK